MIFFSCVDKGEIKMIKYRLRKLTPEETFVLQGMAKSDVDKCKNLNISESELYSMAGNGIITNCVELIAERLYQNQVNPQFITTDMLYEQAEACIKDDFV